MRKDHGQHQAARARFRRLPEPAVLVLSASLLFPGSGTAQSVQIDIEPDRIAVGETAYGRLVITNHSQAPDPRWPETPGLEFRPGGVERRHLIQGRERRSERVFHFSVTAHAEGEYEIAPRNYAADGGPVLVEPVSLRVVSARTEEEIGELPVFARLEIERDSFFVQEIFSVGLALYVHSLDLDRTIQVDGLVRDGIEWSGFQELPETEARIGERLYRVRRFRARARALAPGGYRLAPVFHIQERVRPSGPSASPLGDSRTGAVDARWGTSFRRIPRSVSAIPVDVTVHALPDPNRPSGFSGAVGRFSFDVDIDPAETAVGEPVAVRMTIRGEGNPDLVRAPEFEDHPDFRPYETRLVDRQFNPERGVGTQVFETIVVPRSAQATAIPALAFSFFDPADAEYRTVVRGPFPVTIHPPASEIHAVRPAGPDPLFPGKPLSETGGLRPLKPLPHSGGRAPRFRPSGGSRMRLALDLSPLLIGGALAMAGIRRNRFVRDPAYARGHAAARAARSALRAARRAEREGDTAGFFDRLSEAIAPHRDLQNSLWPHGGLDPAVRERQDRLVHHIDAGRFGGQPAGKMDRQRLLREARAVIRAYPKKPAVKGPS